MSYNLRTTRVAMDNISVGNATGRERTTLSGAPAAEKYAGGSNILTSDGQTSAPGSSTEPTTDFARNRIITMSGGVTSQDPREYPVNQN